MASVTAVALFFVYMNREPTKEVPVAGTTLALLVCLSFLLGCFCSALAGYMGVWISVRANIKVATAAVLNNYPDALNRTPSSSPSAAAPSAPSSALPCASSA